MKEMRGWKVRNHPSAFVIEAILADIKNETVFYAIDPKSMEDFKALSPVQFLTDLFYGKHSVESEAQTLPYEHPDLVPFEQLFSEGDDDAAIDSRQLLAVADLVFAVDLTSREQTLLFGRAALERLVLTGRSSILGVLNIGLDKEAEQITRLAALVEDIKGGH